MKHNKTLLPLIFSLCLLLSLACGGGAPGGGGPGAGQGGGAGGPGPGAGQGDRAGGPGGRVDGPGGASGQAPGSGIGAAGAGASDGAAAAVAGVAESVAGAGNDEANQIIEQYARDILGINVSIIGSGARDGTANVPVSTDSGVEASVDMAGVTYAAVIQGGAASVSLGDGEVSGDVSGDIQDASLGSYSFVQPGTAASNADSALSMLKSTFPGIANRPYTLVETSGSEGYTFMAQSQQQEVDVRDGQAVIIAEVVLAGVTTTQGQSVVYAVVGRGSFATSLAR